MAYADKRNILSDNGNSIKFGYGKYLIVHFWYTSVTYQACLDSPGYGTTKCKKLLIPQCLLWCKEMGEAEVVRALASQ